MASTILAYLLICVYFGTDRYIRSGEKARRLTIDETDRKSTYALVIAFAISILFLLLAPLLNHFWPGLMEIGGGWIWLGILFMLLGIVLRAWATRALGEFYTRTLLTTPDHRVVQDGPYKWVRHPGYSGSLLVWIGAGLAVNNWIVFMIVTMVCLGSYAYRIQSEETMLIVKFGKEYTDYMHRTRRLIPYIY